MEVVQQPASDATDAFPGLYLTALPEQPFLDASTLVLTSQWRSSTDLVHISLDSRAVHTLRPEGSRGAWALLTIGQGAPLLVVSALCAPVQPHGCEQAA